MKSRDAILAGIDAPHKMLITTRPGKTAILMDGGKLKPKRFVDVHAAVKWCDANGAALLYLQPEPTRQN